MEIKTIPLTEIVQTNNHRVTYNRSDLTELMQSLRTDGLLQPIGVRQFGKHWEIVFGNRRFLAATKLGWKEIECHIVSADKDDEALILNIKENVHRKHTTLFEQGRYYAILINDYGLTLSEVAVRVGINIKEVQAALVTYQHIPEEYRETTASIGGVRPGSSKHGIVSATMAKYIVGLKKNHSLTEAETKILFAEAKKDHSSPKKLRVMASFLSSGHSIKEALALSGEYRVLYMYVPMRKTNIEKLEKKYKRPITSILLEKLSRDKEVDVITDPGADYSTASRVMAFKQRGITTVNR